MGILLLTKVILAIFLGFMGSIIIGYFLIRFLRNIQLKQTISDYVGNMHLKKVGTPTLGGLIFVSSTILTIILLMIKESIVFNYELGMVLFIFISYSALGLLDDFISLKRANNEGLTSYQKFIIQALIALFVFSLYLKNGGTTSLNITALNLNIEMGWFYGVFLLFVLVGASNAVNITDGLDGLASGLSVIAFIAFALISIIVGMTNIGIFLFVLIGALMGFLFYNTHPAKIFMGDVGSLSLGAVMGIVAILTHKEITLLVVAFVFVMETLSVIIQVISLRLFKKRLFLMTPLHHHFEKLGWKEQDIVKLFWFFGIILATAGIIYGVWL